jgi:hypothetical protein
MTEMISYKVTELKLEIVNWYFEMSVCVLFCIIRSLWGEGGSRFTLYISGYILSIERIFMIFLAFLSILSSAVSKFKRVLNVPCSCVGLLTLTVQRKYNLTRLGAYM